MRTFKKLSTALLVTLTLFSGSSALAQRAVKADIVYKNAKVYTVNPEQPWAEAIAIKDNEIVFVGDSDAAEKHVGRSTQVVNQEGKVIVPGLVSSHEHPFFVIGFSTGCQIEHTGDKEKMLAALADYVKNNPDGANFSIGGAFEGTVDITNEDIDKIISDKPFFMIATSVHGGWANTKALEIANAEELDKNEHYMFGRHANGKLNGYVASAKTVVAMMDALKIMDEEAIYANALPVFDKFLENGITTVFDAGAPPFENEAFAAIARHEKEGNLNFRLKASCMTQGSHMNIHTMERMEVNTEKYNSEMFDVSTFKIHADGSPDGKTSGLVEAYSDGSGDFGPTSLSKDDIAEMTLYAASKGWDVHIHACGDRTLRYALDAFELARKLGYTENRFSTGHTMMVHPDDYQRFVDLDVVANVFSDKMMPTQNTVNLLGEERAKAYQPNGSLYKKGVKISMSADWPVGDISPWMQAYVSIERKQPGKDEVTILINDEEKLTIEEVIEAYTINGAYQLNMEDIIGSLEVGKRADLIVLDTDIFEVSSDEILKTNVVTTIVDGKVVFEKNSDKKGK